MVNIRKFLAGIGLIPVSSTTIDTKGEMEVLSTGGKLNYHNGTTASPMVTEAHTATLTNKTIDADGTGNSITNIENADIKAAAAIDATKIADGSVSNTEFQYLDGVSSAIQTQLNAKQSTTLTSAHILVGNGSNVAADVAVTGDISITNAGLTAYSGTVPVNKGGTGATSLTSNGVVIGNGTSAVTVTAEGATGTVLHGNTGADPSFSAVSLTADVSGALAIANGGTGQTTKAAGFDALSPMSASGDVIYGGASGTGTRLPKGSDGQILTLASGLPSWAAAGSSAITVVSAGFSVAAWPFTAGQYGDFTSVSLTAGTWAIWLNMFTDNTSVTTTTEIDAGISNTSGNSFPDASNGGTGMSQTVLQPVINTSGATSPMTFGPRVVTIVSTTTFYLKGIAYTSVANLRAGGRMDAIKLA